MATTPLIKTPQADGGTFYTFSSSARDLSKTLNNDELKLVFSKFVLLNIPDFDRLNPVSFDSYENYMQFDTIDGMIASGGLKGDPNVNFTESLQNYALNLEELIISDNLVALLMSQLIENPDLILEISKNAKAFIEKEHHYKTIANTYLKTWGV